MERVTQQYNLFLNSTNLFCQLLLQGQDALDKTVKCIWCIVEFINIIYKALMIMPLYTITKDVKQNNHGVCENYRLLTLFYEVSLKYDHLGITAIFMKVRPF